MTVESLIKILQPHFNSVYNISLNFIKDYYITNVLMTTATAASIVVAVVAVVINK